MTFIELATHPYLDTSSNNLIDDFFIPVLSHATRYDRGVGYFSSGWLKIAAKGMANFAKNNGKARWVTSPIYSKNDLDAIHKGKLAQSDSVLYTLLKKNICDLISELENDTLSTLAWLIADKVIEFKLALPIDKLKYGEFHDKFGVFSDECNNQISFNGSYNDSIQGTINYESIKIFYSWLDNQNHLIKHDSQRFENLWNNLDPNIKVFEIPDAIKAEIIKYKSNHCPYQSTNSNFSSFVNFTSKPNLPKNIQLRDYQNDAITSWFNNDCKGIFEMATGTGKTITALASSVNLYNEKKRLAVIITCPYVHLIQQWEKEAIDFGYKPILAFDSKNKWLDKISNKLFSFNHEDTSNLCVITSHSTFIKNHFINIVSQINNPLLLIADEAHHLGAEASRNFLPDNINYRLALSATPKRWFDDQGTEAIANYFGQTVFEFPLEKAIKEGFLTPYYYHPIPIQLNDDEIERYRILTTKIVPLIEKAKSDQAINERLSLLLIKRSNILKNANAKIEKLDEIINSVKDLSHSIFYCVPKQIEDVLNLLGHKNHIAVHQFTFEENYEERQKILQSFNEGKLKALIAMKCLDEGVDVPSTKNAFILASSTNPREFIQRRGRILRKHPGKKNANIYDFITIPPTPKNIFELNLTCSIT